jgi:hypothetical protein
MFLNPRKILVFTSLLATSLCQAAPASLLVNGQAAGDKIPLVAGTRPVFSFPSTETRQVQVTEKGSGVCWYQGPAAAMKLQPWLIRSGPQTVTVSFETPAGQPPEQKDVVLEVAPANGQELYPGLVAKVIRLDGSIPPLPSAASFKPRFRALGASVPSAPEYAAYPAYRTSESVLPAEPRPGQPEFQACDYWHLMVPEPASQLEDLRTGIPAAALIEGLLLVEQAGVYRFQIDSTLPARLAVGTRTAIVAADFAADQTQAETVPEKNRNKRPAAIAANWPAHQQELTVELKAGLVPFQLTIERRHPEAPARYKLAWQPPGAPALAPLSGDHFLHAVAPEVETAYRLYSKAYPWRSLAIKKQKTADPELAKLVAGFDPAAYAGTDADYNAMQAKLMKGFLGDAALAGSPQLASQLLELTRTRFAFMRQHPEQLDPKSFAGKIRGDLLQHQIALRPFLEACLRQPQLQASALATQAELEMFTAIIFRRSFLAEEHQGTNDGYGDQNNFLVNIWRGAEAWDDPVAFDAARSLYDSHFRYGGQGLHPDGIFSFHCANGRHINMGGYGDNWVSRVMNNSRAGTPWGSTQEQYRRLADWTLAYEWFFYKGAAAFTTFGRHNSHQGKYNAGYADRLFSLSKDLVPATVVVALREMKTRLATNQPLVGNHFFYRHLQMMHRRADYYLDVKMNSPLVGGIETFAGAHPGNLSFADGVTTLLRHGDEYRALHTPYDITQSLWRYRSLPGTTQNNYEAANPDGCNNPDRYRAGGGSRAGGVSDGEFGHCGFEFNHGTKARKLFAFTENGLFVLGTGITGDKPAPAGDYSYRTTLNQCTFQAEVTITNAKGESTVIKLDETERTVTLKLDQKYWIEHNGIGYLVLPTGAERGAGQPGELIVRVSLRTTLNRLAAAIMDNPKMAPYKERCQKAFAANPPRQAKVLEIWIDHGTLPPKEATCAYVVAMRPEARKPADWLADCGVKILANTAACQAVEDTLAKITHAFFYEPGTVGNITVKQPASVMLRQHADGRKILVVQDPVAACTGKLADMCNVLQVTVDGKEQSIQMPGAFDPDDRYRGGMKSIEN